MATCKAKVAHFSARRGRQKGAWHCGLCFKGIRWAKGRPAIAPLGYL